MENGSASPVFGSMLIPRRSCYLSPDAFSAALGFTPTALSKLGYIALPKSSVPATTLETDEVLTQLEGCRAKHVVVRVNVYRNHIVVLVLHDGRLV